MPILVALKNWRISAMKQPENTDPKNPKDLFTQKTIVDRWSPRWWSAKKITDGKSHQNHHLQTIYVFQVGMFHFASLEPTKG